MPRIQTLQELSQRLQHSVKSQIPLSGFNVDSRTLVPGDVYCALPGKKVDGHAFVQEAFQKGARAAIVQKGFALDACKGALFFVEDVLKSLQGLARDVFEEKRPGKVIAVTGSLGKTTTKDFIAALISAKYRTSVSPGNSNSQVGLPLAILNHSSGDEEVSIFEMGMTEAKEIERLVEIAPPDIAVITKASLVHAVNFKGLQDIVRAKSEIFLHPRTAWGIYASEIDDLIDISKVGSCTKIKFQLENEKAAHTIAKKNSEWVYKSASQEFALTGWSLPGTHNLHNLLAALTCASVLGFSTEELQGRLPLLKTPDKRFQQIEKGGILFINDSYNAAPESVKAALNTLPAPAHGGRKIAVLGSMLELGKYSEESHLQTGLIALDTVDSLICFGEECAPMAALWRQKGREVEELGDHSAIIEKLRQTVRPGDVVLLKGSKSKQLWKVLDEF